MTCTGISRRSLPLSGEVPTLASSSADCLLDLNFLVELLLGPKFRLVERSVLIVSSGQCMKSVKFVCNYISIAHIHLQALWL